MREELHNAVKPREFTAHKLSRFTYDVEKLDTVLARAEAANILKAQWLETGSAELDFAPNFDFYRQIETVGGGALIVAREYGRAIGFLWVIVHPNINATATMVSSISTWFIEQRPTRALLERSLLRAGIAWARFKGAKRMVIETSYKYSAGRLLEAMGFEPDKIGYKMPLEKENA